MESPRFKHPNGKDSDKPGGETRAQPKEGTFEAHFFQENP
jgi:hypothetical protein